MFTGIVQTTGMVRTIQRGSGAARLVIEAPELARPLVDGASICVSGVCLTVTRSDDRLIDFDVVPESLTRSTLATATPGDRVNLERALRAGDGLDGHLVQGHVDGMARVERILHADKSREATFVPDKPLMPFIIPKGSIAIDGVSLTISSVAADRFSVAWIPTTLACTTLGDLKSGDRVNIETDIVARTIVTTMQRWRGTEGETGVTMNLLREQGFV